MAFPQIHRTASAWAHADRVADDLAAELANLDQIIAKLSGPIPPGLVQAREMARRELANACQLAGQAEDDLRDAARQMLDVHIVQPVNDNEELVSELRERIRALESELTARTGDTP